MQPPNLCIHFQRGFCSYGNSCRFLHQQAGTFAQGGGRFGGERWTKTQGRGGRDGGRFSYYHESHVQASASVLTPSPRPAPAREWSTPLNDAGLSQQGTSFNFRFMSWNILAAELAHTHAAELYPQAHRSCLAWPQRLAAVVRHVAAQRPDVLCLQEVDDWPGLQRELLALGYEGVHVQRTGGRGDGCATLWLRDRLRLAARSSQPRPGSRAVPDPEVETPASGSGSGLRSSGLGDGGKGVHKIQMADHGLKDNVALLVHLVPRRGGGSGGSGAGGDVARAAEREHPAGTKPDPNSMDTSGDGSGSSVSGDSSKASSSSDDSGGGVQDPSQLAQRPAGRREKRTRQSGDGAAMEAVAAAAAATTAIASLPPYPRGAAGTSGAASAPGAAAAARGTGGSAGNQDTGAVRLRRHLRKGFWVANTHILFNTKRGDIKLGQLRVILSELAARASEEKEEGEHAGQEAEAGAAPPQPAVPVIFAGDFNAAPGSGLYRFLRYGTLHLAREDRRELSGQVEGYGYPQLQRDAMSGRPVRLARWGPTDPATQPAAADGVGYGSGGGLMYGSTSTAASSMEGWRLTSAQQAQQQPLRPQPEPFAAQTYGRVVRWEEEELIHALGRAAVGRAVVEARQASGVASGASEEAVDMQAGRNPYGNGNRFRSGFESVGQGGGQRPWRAPPGSAAALAAAHWSAVTQAAVVRHPLQLRSAYAAMDEQEREPLFTTLHARYVGTVDFVWYTPGDVEAEGPLTTGGRTAGRAEMAGGAGAGASGPGTGKGRGKSRYQLTPMRVLHPPDPLSYPYGMPCGDWPSDHVSLVVDFRLS